MAKLRFTDGVEIDISGKLHIVRCKDGLYLAGDNALEPIASYEEGYTIMISNRLTNEGGITEGQVREIQKAIDDGRTVYRTGSGYIRNIASYYHEGTLRVAIAYEAATSVDRTAEDWQASDLRLSSFIQDRDELCARSFDPNADEDVYEADHQVW